MVFCKVSEGVVFGQNKDLLNFGAHPDLLLFFARQGIGLGRELHYRSGLGNILNQTMYSNVSLCTLKLQFLLIYFFT